MKKHILFVCTGNTFRSASADYLFESLLEKKQDNSYIVSSAGTRGNPLGVYEETIQKVKTYGVDMSAHKYRILNQKIIDDADIIVCMSQVHVDFIQEHFNTSSYLFNELAIGEKVDLKDDDEAHGEYSDLGDFIVMTVETIYSRLPGLYNKLKSLE